MESKILVFSLFATSASFAPFFALFVQEKGFDPFQVGALVSFSRVVMLFATPVVCAVAEARSIHQSLMATLACAAAMTMVVFYLTESKPLIVACLIVHSICSSAKGAITDTLVLAACRRSNAVYAHQRLWGSASWGAVSMLIGIALREYYASTGGVASYAAVPLIHAAALVIFATALLCVFRLPGNSRDVEYSQVSQGNGDSEMAAKREADADHDDDNDEKRDEESSDAATAEPCRSKQRGTTSATTIDAAIAGATETSELTSTAHRGAQIQQYGRFVLDARIAGPIALGVTALSAAETGLSNFCFIYVVSRMAASPMLLSVILCINAASEIVCFACGGWLVHRIGVAKLFVVSALAFALKAHVYAVATTPLAIQAVEALHGLCFAFLWTAAVAHVDAVSRKLVAGSTSAVPPTHGDADADPTVPEASEKQHSVRQSAVAMTSLWFFYAGLPPIFAGVGWGYVIRHFGFVALFHCISGLCVCVAAGYAVMGSMGLLVQVAPRTPIVPIA